MGIAMIRATTRRRRRHLHQPVRPVLVWPLPRRNAVEALPACIADVDTVVRGEGLVFWASLTERLTDLRRADAIRLAMRHRERDGTVRVVALGDGAVGMRGCRRRGGIAASREEKEDDGYRGRRAREHGPRAPAAPHSPAFGGEGELPGTSPLSRTNRVPTDAATVGTAEGE